ncbi:MAG: ankyrin repeat domain-containing protein [Bdellovibrionales bacterium]|jgi:ankyrin repeat protein|nr:ankyrin repeat domain-containing protein [Bdellovibrionales bacterium]
MPTLRNHANDSFSKKPPRPEIPAARRREVAEACDAVIEACCTDDADALRRTLENHAAFLPQLLNARDDDGWTALHVAVGWCALDCVRLLLDSGANPALTNTQGQSPRELATFLGYESLAADIRPVAGAAETAVRKAHQAQLEIEIATITKGLPKPVTLHSCTLRRNIRRPS